jgi:hypothetical protein
VTTVVSDLASPLPRDSSNRTAGKGWVERTLGAGTTFSFALSAAPASDGYFSEECHVDR